MISDNVQGSQHILTIFDGSVDNGSKDSEVFGRSDDFKLPGYFLFDLDITDCLFRGVIVWRNVGMIEKREEVVPVFDDSLLECNKDFEFRIYYLFQQIIQFVFKDISAMAGRIVIWWCKPFFGSLTN